MSSRRRGRSRTRKSEKKEPERLGERARTPSRPRTNPHATYQKIGVQPMDAWTKTVISVMVVALTLYASQKIALLRPFFNPEAFFGAVALISLVVVVGSSTYKLLTFLDGVRGVDYSEPQILKTGSGTGCFCVPSPHVGLLIGVSAATSVGYFLGTCHQTEPYFNWKTYAGMVLLSFACLVAFFVTLSLLPIERPNPEVYLPEIVPGFSRRILRFLVPLLPLLYVAMYIQGLASYWLTLLKTPGALFKTGTFTMNIIYTHIVGQPIPFARADYDYAFDDYTWSRQHVNIIAGVQNLRNYMIRNPVKRPTAPSDEAIWGLCSKTVLAYNIADDPDNENEKILDMTPLQWYTTNPDRYYDVQLVYLRATETLDDGTAVKGVAWQVKMKDGSFITPDMAQEWDLVKIHLVSTTNLFFPAMQHNWVHFHFADNGTAMAHDIIPRGCMLHKIMEPFVLANTYTNHNGLAGIVMSADIGEYPGFVDHMMTINATSNEYFVNSVQHRTLTFYTGVSNYALSDDVLIERLKFGFPPNFEDYDNVPYTVFLKNCYHSYRKFAQVVIDSISDEEQAMLDHWVDQTVVRTTSQFQPRAVDTVDVLATYMWQVSVLHSADHQAYFYWVKPMGCASGTHMPLTGPLAHEKVLLADDVRIYENFMNVAGFYNVGTPDDSLAGVSFIDLNESNSGPLSAVETAMTELRHDVDRYLKDYINDPDLNGPNLDCSKIASAILM